MRVRELIEALKGHWQDGDVVIWDTEAGDWLPVVEALYEDGTSHVALLTVPSGATKVADPE